MWIFLSRRLRRWLLLALGTPLLARLLHLAGDALERRTGPTGLTRGLRSAEQELRRRRPGGRARRQRRGPTR